MTCWVRRATRVGVRYWARGDRRKLRLPLDWLAVDDVMDEVLDLDEALARSAQTEPANAELVRLRFFAGLSLNEAAATLGISPTTADKHWAYARVWLFNEMRLDKHPRAD